MGTLPYGSVGKECPNCGGGGELVELEKDGVTDVVKGTTAWERVPDSGWTYAGVRECQRCHGFGRLNPGE